TDPGTYLLTHTSVEPDITAHGRGDDAPAKLAAEKRCVLSARCEGVRAHRPRRANVDGDPVVGVRCDAEHACRSVGQCPQRGVLIAPTGAYATEDQRECGLEHADPERRLIELDVLANARVRRVISSDRVDRAVGEPDPERAHVVQS